MRCKNNTIQRLGVARHIGKVLSVDANTGQIETELLLSKKKYTIKLDSDTKMLKKGGETIDISDIQVGDKIRTRGTLNRLQKKVTADVIAKLNNN